MDHCEHGALLTEGCDDCGLAPPIRTMSDVTTNEPMLSAEEEEKVCAASERCGESRQRVEKDVLYTNASKSPQFSPADAEQLVRLRAALGRAIETQIAIAAQLDQWAQESINGGWSTHQVGPMRVEASRQRHEANALRHALGTQEGEI